MEQTSNPFPLVKRTILAHFELTEQEYERRCEAEREGAPRFCSACQHYHEEDGECPYVASDQLEPML